MSSVVFLRAINVGGANLCKPAQLAKKLKKFDIVNIGAVGTFVVRKEVSESILRKAIANQLSFKCEMMIVPARDLLKRRFGRQFQLFEYACGGSNGPKDRHWSGPLS